MNDLIVKKVHKDARGDLTILGCGDHEVLVFTIRKGHARGGDYHKTKQYDVVLMGEVECRFKYGLESQGEVIKILRCGDTISFEAGSPHIFIALGDSLMVEWLTGAFEKIMYPPYRKIVEAKM